ncbi:tRNAHis guanylyltransferase [Pluteus cervinus]|uniref:tRNAHis guanylyltransferase n=1 Tax=Pluteus cervinus TaxID=181527 RepID=A0ACD3B6H3_9AGAR|nr:tRNAHis guanylyltransferase [Pluteus cervinus]
MANSKFAYVRNFELPDPLLPETYIVFRLDGHSFHRFSEVHDFTKPNDTRALELMDHAARSIMGEYPDITLAFGESDEYSFLLRKSTALYNRRQAKLVSTFTSFFTSHYVFHWSTYFPNTPLQYPPTFDGRIVLYPAEKHVRDYFSWRQADTHINNLYNTVFWALVQQGGETTTQAHAILRGTVSKDKHEILFTRFGINYNTLDERFKKGSILVRELLDDQPKPPPQASIESSQTQTPTETPSNESNHPQSTSTETSSETSPQPHSSSSSPTDGDPELKKSKPRRKEKKTKSGTVNQPMRIDLVHVDIIKDDFWEKRPWLLAD